MRARRVFVHDARRSGSGGQKSTHRPIPGCAFGPEFRSGSSCGNEESPRCPKIRRPPLARGEKAKHLAVPLPVSPFPWSPKSLSRGGPLGGPGGARARQRTPEGLESPNLYFVASKIPKMSSKPAQAWLHHAEEARKNTQDGLTTAQEASKTPQEDSKRTPQKTKIALSNLKHVRDKHIRFLVFPASRTASEAPERAPRRCRP